MKTHNKHVRTSGSHVKDQVLRFCRLFATAFVLQAAALNLGHLGRSALVSAGIAALEVAVRQYSQVVPVVSGVSLDKVLPVAKTEGV